MSWPDADARAIAAALRRKIQGEVRFDGGSRALYATDASNYRQVPIGVVLPRDGGDVVETVAVCRAFGAPVLPRGGGTSLAGQCCNVAVVLDFSKYMHRVVELDPAAARARVQPGIVLDSLQNATAGHHLAFGPDPATHSHCTLGGMIGNNSCGVHSVMAGRTSENIEELEILLYDGTRMRVGATAPGQLEHRIAQGGRPGEIYARLKTLMDRYGGLIRERFPQIPRRVSGYNLTQLLPENGFHVARALVGSEGTCVTVLEATLRLVHSPPYRVLLVFGYPDVYEAGRHVPHILEHGPIGLEGIDDVFVRDMRKKGLHSDKLSLLPEGGGWLLVEFGGESPGEALERAREAAHSIRRNGGPQAKILEDAADQHKVWQVRESGLGATALVPGKKDTWEGWEDSAVPPERLGDYLRDLRALLSRYEYACSLYGHFGDGCVHTRIDFDLKSEAGIRKFRSFISEAVDLVLRHGGSFSGEHGDGQSRAEFLPRMFGAELVRAFEEFKSIWDPGWKMNPGKIVRPNRIDENLRLGAGYDPPEPRTHFHFVQDRGSFARAAERCVGVGECRRLEHGTMCPSYMVTREEKHSTRGRARLLFEMLEANPLSGGWRSEEVKDALDLCLSCKGCKADCPVNVDMAAYKAEFLSHYYAGRLRPRHAYASGLIFWSARAASHAPRLANFFTQSPLLASLAKLLAGYAPERRLPAFAHQPFKEWFRTRARNNPGRPRVILWPDTFTNFFQPAVGIAAVEVLEHAGFEVKVPRASLCCGRPLYDYGMLGTARRLLHKILDTLRPAIRQGIPVVGLEPSCVSVFRDELPDLLSGDEDAAQLSRQTWHLSEFLEHHAGGYRPPPLRRKALVHGHCHHKAVLKLEAEESVLRKLGLDFQVLDSGCCGMAGGFGYEAGEPYRVSVACGERVLLPAVRGAAEDTLILADGFSCREQISQLTGRRALHLAEAMQMAIEQARPLPESAPIREVTPAQAVFAQTAGLLGAGALLAGAGTLLKTRSRTR
ncbi:MAG: FAD-binding protein [Acidobacteria bacterium]|nr:FAD-binding protein [Acidobacteriota bacterium]